MNNRGITLIELIVVIVIIGILVVALGFEFQGWMGRYRVESQTKNIYMDMMNTRARAMQRNRAHSVDFPTAKQYRIQEDTNDDNAPDTLLPTYPKTVEYDITWAGGTISFDRNGNAQPSASPLGDTLCLYTTNDPDYDCIIISQTRINMGKIANQGGACNAANCTAR